MSLRIPERTRDPVRVLRLLALALCCGHTVPLAHATAHGGADPAPAAPRGAAAEAPPSRNPQPSSWAAHAKMSNARPALPPTLAPSLAPRAPADQAAAMQGLRAQLADKLGAAHAGADAPPRGVVRVSAREGVGATLAERVAPAAHDAPPAEPHGAPKPRPRRAAAAPHADGHAGGHAKAHAPHWSYAGAEGPEHWGKLNPSFAACAKGDRQSPIDIRGGLSLELDPIRFDYRASPFKVIDNGHTVQVNVGWGNAIEVAGRRYDLLQFHFHRPSEERIDGRQFDMVAHLVHKDPEGRLAVVAVLLDRGSAHALVQSVWNNLPLEKNVEQPASQPIDLNHLLPADRRYFTYMGSLTTPPCSEGVLWMVMQQPVPIAAEQVATFARLYPMNARPVQRVAGRLIKQN